MKLLNLPIIILNIINNYSIFYFKIKKKNIPNEWKYLILHDNQFSTYHKIYIPSINLIQYFRSDNILDYPYNNHNWDLIFFLEFFMYNIILYRNFIYLKYNNDSIKNYFLYYSRYKNYSKYYKKKIDCINHLLWYRKNFYIFNILINRFSSDINIDLYNQFYYLPSSNDKRYNYNIINYDNNRIRNKDIQILIQSLNNYYKSNFTSILIILMKIFFIKDLSNLIHIFEYYGINNIYNKLINKNVSYEKLIKLNNFIKINNNFKNIICKNLNFISKNNISLYKYNLLIN